MGHGCVCDKFAGAEAVGLDLSGANDLLSYHIRVPTAGFAPQRAKAHRRNVDVDINPIQQWPRYPGDIPLNLSRRTFTFSPARPEVAARARVHRSNQNEPRREDYRSLGPGDRYRPVFQRLANHLEDMSRELGKFIQK